ncbi:MAG: hypothetical protein DBY36_05050 [Clostridiales bacterium]|nr:MAG: hypothetical protein DBY36_05050 [Clostridiales bacterium]
MVLYLDVLMAVNLMADYALLRAAAKITGHIRNRLRIFIAAALGAAYAALVCMPALEWLGHFLIRLLVGIAMSAIVFGLNRACVRKTLVFFLLSFLLGGAVLALSYAAGGAVGLYNGAVYINTSLPSLALVVAAVYGVVTLVCAVGGRRAQAMRRVLPAVAKLGGRESAFSVLADTGCLVQDPLTARPVMLVSLAGAAALLPEGMASAIEEGADAAELIGRYAGQRLPLRPVFCKGLGGQTEMLVSFLPDSLTVDGKPCDAVIAVTKDGPDGAEGFCAVVNSDAV